MSLNVDDDDKGGSSLMMMNKSFWFTFDKIIFSMKIPSFFCLITLFPSTFSMLKTMLNVVAVKW